MKITDKQKLINLFQEFGIKHHFFTESRYICFQALDHGAAESVSIVDADFNFRKDGSFVGVNSSSVKTFSLPLAKSVQLIGNLDKEGEDCS